MEVAGQRLFRAVDIGFEQLHIGPQHGDKKLHQLWIHQDFRRRAIEFANRFDERCLWQLVNRWVLVPQMRRIAAGHEEFERTGSLVPSQPPRYLEGDESS